MITMRLLFFAAMFGFLGAILGNATAAHAEAFGMSSDSKDPIEVYADNGIEWVQDSQQFVARGNARAIRGRLEVRGDTLTAYYRRAGGANGSPTGGGSQIYRLEVVGHAHIFTPTESAFGDTGVYDVEQGTMVLRGGNLKLTTETDVITARDSLEYYDQKHLAVARGSAQFARDGRKIKADTLTATFRESSPQEKRAQQSRKSSDQESDLKIERMDAYGNVVVETPSETAVGERGVYEAATSLATLTGKVKITRDKSVLNGDTAIVNLQTGVSRIFSQPGSQRVQGVFVPSKREDGAEKPAKKKTP